MNHARELLERYQAFLLDAYGVLLDGSGAIGGAAAFVEALRAAGKTIRVVTNDASRLEGSHARRFQSLGLDLREDEIHTSGSLLAPWVRERGGLRCLVLGPPESGAYVSRGGGHPVMAHEAGDFDAVVVGDESGFDLLDGVERAANALIARPDLPRVVPNPDVVYPKGGGRVGLASSGVATLIERMVAERVPDAPAFERLGKPRTELFAQALGDIPSERAVVLGDQLATDLRGAAAAGVDGALVLTGVTSEAPAGEEVRWVLPSLQL